MTVSATQPIQEEDEEDIAADESLPRKRNRNRPGLSCHGCRRRKYRCDGKRPTCIPCERSKIACVYDVDMVPTQPFNGIGTAPAATTAIPTPNTAFSMPKVPARAKRQNAQTPRWANLMTGRDPLTGKEQSDVQDSNENRHSTMLGIGGDDLTYVRDFRGSGFRTQFCGFTHSGKLFCDFAQLLVYSKQFMDRHPMLIRACVEMRQRDKAVQAKLKMRSEQRHTRPLYTFLPTQDQTTSYVELYLHTVDQCYHLLHKPTFDRQYRKLWEHDLSETDENFVAQVLLMCATVICCKDEATQSYSGSASVSRELAWKWIDRVEVWLRSQSQKHTNLAFFQVHCIILLARFVNGVKVKRWWPDTGFLYRFAVCAGIHLDTTTARLGSVITPFEREMRRRVWAVIEDLDLAATIHRGIAPAIGVSDSDCGIPTNVPDDQLDEDMDIMPLALRQASYHSVTPLIVARDTYATRRDLCTFLNSAAATNITQADLLMHEERILKALQAIPSWPAPADPTNPPSVRPSALPRALQRSELLELLMLLHQRAFESPAASTHRYYARQGRTSAAVALIRAYDELSKPASILLVCLRGDVFQAAMSICYDMCDPDPRTDALMLSRPAPMELCALVERAVDVMELRIEHAVGLLKRYWLLGCAHSLVRRISDPDGADRHEANAANRIGGVLYKQLSLQVDTADAAEATPRDVPVKTSSSVATSIQPESVLAEPIDYEFSLEDMPYWEGDLGDINVEDILFSF